MPSSVVRFGRWVWGWSRLRASLGCFSAAKSRQGDTRFSHNSVQCSIPGFLVIERWLCWPVGTFYSLLDYIFCSVFELNDLHSEVHSSPSKRFVSTQSPLVNLFLFKIPKVVSISLFWLFYCYMIQHPTLSGLKRQQVRPLSGSVG